MKKKNPSNLELNAEEFIRINSLFTEYLVNSYFFVLLVVVLVNSYLCVIETPGLAQNIGPTLIPHSS